MGNNPQTPSEPAKPKLTGLQAPSTADESAASGVSHYPRWCWGSKPQPSTRIRLVFVQPWDIEHLSPQVATPLAAASQVSLGAPFGAPSRLSRCASRPCATAGSGLLKGLPLQKHLWGAPQSPLVSSTAERDSQPKTAHRPYRVFKRCYPPAQLQTQEPL